jgi:hypothetical protein
MLPQITTSTLARQVRRHFFLVASVMAALVLASMVVVLATTKPAGRPSQVKTARDAAGARMSDRLKEIGERFEDYAEPAKQDIAHLLALLYVMECENENLRENVRQINEQLGILLS